MSQKLIKRNLMLENAAPLSKNIWVCQLIERKNLLNPSTFFRKGQKTQVTIEKLIVDQFTS